MKKLAFALLAVLAIVAPHWANAAQPTFGTGAKSTYGEIHSTSVAISSGGVWTLPASSGYRLVRIQLNATTLMDGVTVAFKLNGSTANITSTGYVVRLSTVVNGITISTPGSRGLLNTFEFETNGPIYGQLFPGIDATLYGGSVTVSGRYWSRQLFQ